VNKQQENINWEEVIDFEPIEVELDLKPEVVIIEKQDLRQTLNNRKRKDYPQEIKREPKRKETENQVSISSYKQAKTENQLLKEKVKSLEEKIAYLGQELAAIKAKIIELSNLSIAQDNLQTRINGITEKRSKIEEELLENLS
jgi:hypothetical protein